MRERAGGMIRHTEHLRVNWVDTDASGLIHYTAALRYFEVAEHSLMRKLFPGGRPGADLRLPRVHVEADYKTALRYPDEFSCTVRVDRVGRSSVTYAYEIDRSDGTACIVGKIVAAAVDAAGRSTPLPDALRKGLEAAL